jgi:hypothetical protein
MTVFANEPLKIAQYYVYLAVNPPAESQLPCVLTRFRLVVGQTLSFSRVQRVLENISLACILGISVYGWHITNKAFSRKHVLVRL